MIARPPMIEAVGLGKCYRLYESNGQRLLHALTGHSRSREHWALRDCNLRVERGEAVGIIGRNGSGKSTLLELIAGTLKRTTGSIAVRGRVAALLELGSGFNPEYTGRENVFLNGAILGVSRQELERKYDEIVDFAEIGEYIDQPVKEYSSGMLVRLAFAVQVAVVPDILIVDEALSVGDIFFQQKCFERINEIRGKGTTILFVSHDLATVRDLCDKALYLCRGEVAYIGASSEAIWRYRQETRKSQPTIRSETIPVNVGRDVVRNAKLASAYWVRTDETLPSAPTRLLGVSLFDENGDNVLQLKIGAWLTFVVFVQAYSEVACDFTIEIKNRYGQIVTSNGSHTSGIQPTLTGNGDIDCFELKMQCMLEAGQYTFQVSIDTGNHDPNQGYPVDVSPWLGPLTITWDYANERAPFLGMFGVPISVRFIRLVAE